MTPSRVLMLVWGSSVLGCMCTERVQRTVPRIEVIDDTGAERSVIDFGQVQLNSKASARIRVRNSGNAVLTVSEATFSNAKFGVGEVLPVSLEPNGELMFAFTFTPTEPDLREEGTVALKTDDPQRGQVTISLKGTGIAAVATVMPRVLDFGEVYLGENKSLTLTLTNAGSNTLSVLDAGVNPAPPAGLTADLTPLTGQVPANASVSATLRFAPQVVGDLSGAVELTLGGELGSVRVPVRGKAIEAVPRVCFRFEDSPLETCTDRTTQSLTFPFGSLCDNRLFPADAGQTCFTTDGGVVAGGRAGRLYVRNEGNTSLSYSLNFNLIAGGRCDAGTVSDFEFGNVPALPDGGRRETFTVPSAKLPNLVTDPRPWETSPVAVSYRPTSRCRDDAADQVQLFWLRQGEPAGTTRLPQALTLIFTGQSLLPRGVPSDVNITLSGQVTSVGQDYPGLLNVGDAPLTIRSAQLWQAEFFGDGGRGPGPFEECVPGQLSSGDCPYFFWAAPPSVPTTLAGTPQASAPVSRVLGRIGFGQQDGGSAPVVQKAYRIFAVFETNDPYGAPCPFPTTGSCVVSTIRAVAQ